MRHHRRSLLLTARSSFSAVLVSGLLLFSGAGGLWTPTAIAASAALLEQGATSTVTNTFIFQENSTAALPSAGGSFTLTITDSAQDPAHPGVHFVGSPALNAPGSLGASVSLALDGSSFTVTTTGADSFNIEQMMVSGLYVAANLHAALGSVQYALSGGDPDISYDVMMTVVSPFVVAPNNTSPDPSDTSAPVTVNDPILSPVASITFNGGVSSAGETTVTSNSSGPALPNNFEMTDPPLYYDVSTTAGYTAPITVCFSYAGMDPIPSELWHYDTTIPANLGGPTWVSLPVTYMDPLLICGQVDSLSPFVLGGPAAASPSAPTLSGASWNRSLALAWSATAFGSTPVTAYRLSWSVDAGNSWNQLIFGLAVNNYTLPIAGDNLPVLLSLETRYGATYSPAASLALTTLPAPTIAVTRLARGFSVNVNAPPSPDRGAAVGYAVALSSDGGITWASYNSASAARNLTGLADNTGYEIRGRALYGTSAWGPYSDIATLTTPDVATPVLVATPGIRSVAASWPLPVIANPATPTGYKIEWSSNGGISWATAATTTPAKTIAGLPDNTNIDLRAYALYPGFAGPMASTSVHTPALDSGHPVVTLTSLGAGFALSWSMAPTTFSPLLSGYLLSWSSNGGSSYTSQTVGPTAVSYAVSGISGSATPISATVSPLYGSVVGTAGSVSGAVLPIPVLIANPALSSILVKASAPAAGSITASSYTFSYSSDHGLTWTSYTGPLSPRTLSGLSSGTAYLVRVRALYASAWSSYNSPLTVTPQ